MLVQPGTWLEPTWPRNKDHCGDRHPLTHYVFSLPSRRSAVKKKPSSSYLTEQLIGKRKTLPSVPISISSVDELGNQAFKGRKQRAKTRQWTLILEHVDLNSRFSIFWLYDTEHNHFTSLTLIYSKYCCIKQYHQTNIKTNIKRHK